MIFMSAMTLAALIVCTALSVGASVLARLLAGHWAVLNGLLPVTLTRLGCAYRPSSVTSGICPGRWVTNLM